MSPNPPPDTSSMEGTPSIDVHVSPRSSPVAEDDVVCQSSVGAAAIASRLNRLAEDIDGECSSLKESEALSFLHELDGLLGDGKLAAPEVLRLLLLVGLNLLIQNSPSQTTSATIAVFASKRASLKRPTAPLPALKSLSLAKTVIQFASSICGSASNISKTLLGNTVKRWAILPLLSMEEDGSDPQRLGAAAFNAMEKYLKKQPADTRHGIASQGASRIAIVNGLYYFTLAAIQACHSAPTEELASLLEQGATLLRAAGASRQSATVNIGLAALSASQGDFAGARSKFETTGSVTGQDEAQKAIALCQLLSTGSVEGIEWRPEWNDIRQLTRDVDLDVDPAVEIHSRASLLLIADDLAASKRWGDAGTVLRRTQEAIIPPPRKRRRWGVKAEAATTEAGGKATTSGTREKSESADASGPAVTNEENNVPAIAEVPIHAEHLNQQMLLAELMFQKGRLKHSQGRYEEALDDYRTAVSCNPGHLAARFGTVQCASATDNLSICAGNLGPLTRRCAFAAAGLAATIEIKDFLALREGPELVARMHGLLSSLKNASEANNADVHYLRLKLCALEPLAMAGLPGCAQEAYETLRLILCVAVGAAFGIPPAEAIKKSTASVSTKASPKMTTTEQKSTDALNAGARPLSGSALPLREGGPANESAMSDGDGASSSLDTSAANAIARHSTLPHGKLQLSASHPPGAGGKPFKAPADHSDATLVACVLKRHSVPVHYCVAFAALQAATGKGKEAENTLALTKVYAKTVPGQEQLLDAVELAQMTAACAAGELDELYNRVKRLSQDPRFHNRLEFGSIRCLAYLLRGNLPSGRQLAERQVSQVYARIQSTGGRDPQLWEALAQALDVLVLSRCGVSREPFYDRTVETVNKYLRKEGPRLQDDPTAVPMPPCLKSRMQTLVAFCLIERADRRRCQEKKEAFRRKHQAATGTQNGGDQASQPSQAPPHRHSSSSLLNESRDFSREAVRNDPTNWRALYLAAKASRLLNQPGAATKILRLLQETLQPHVAAGDQPLIRVAIERELALLAVRDPKATARLQRSIDASLEDEVVTGPESVDQFLIDLGQSVVDGTVASVLKPYLEKRFGPVDAAGAAATAISVSRKAAAGAGSRRSSTEEMAQDDEQLAIATATAVAVSENQSLQEKAVLARVAQFAVTARVQKEKELRNLQYLRNLVAETESVIRQWYEVLEARRAAKTAIFQKDPKGEERLKPLVFSLEEGFDARQLVSENFPISGGALQSWPTPTTDLMKRRRQIIGDGPEGRDSVYGPSQTRRPPRPPTAEILEKIPREEEIRKYLDKSMKPMLQKLKAMEPALLKELEDEELGRERLRMQNELAREAAEEERSRRQQEYERQQQQRELEISEKLARDAEDIAFSTPDLDGSPPQRGRKAAKTSGSSKRRGKDTSGRSRSARTGADSSSGGVLPDDDDDDFIDDSGLLLPEPDEFDEELI